VRRYGGRNSKYHSFCRELKQVYAIAKNQIPQKVRFLRNLVQRKINNFEHQAVFFAWTVAFIISKQEDSLHDSGPGAT